MISKNICLTSNLMMSLPATGVPATGVPATGVLTAILTLEKFNKTRRHSGSSCSDSARRPAKRAIRNPPIQSRKWVTLGTQCAALKRGIPAHLRRYAMQMSGMTVK